MEAREGRDGILNAICLECGSDFNERGVDLCLLQGRAPILSVASSSIQSEISASLVEVEYAL